MRRALITGGAGFIGLSLARTLSDRGIAVDLVDNFSRGRDDIELAVICSRPAVRKITLDLTRPHSTDTLDDDYDLIFHCAAILGVKNVVNRSYDTLTVNVALVVEALRLAGRQKDLSAFVFISTSEIYAGTLLAGLLEFPTPEQSMLALPALTEPRTSYMLSKIYGEALTWQSGLPGLVVRPHNIYGPRMRAEHVVPELIDRMCKAAPGSELAVYSPMHSRTFCYIDDAAEFIVRLAMNPSAIGSAWNVGTETPEYSMMRVAEIVRALVRADIELVPGDDTQGSPSRRCPSMKRTICLCGYQPRVSLEEGIERTFHSYRKGEATGAMPPRWSTRNEISELT